MILRRDETVRGYGTYNNHRGSKNEKNIGKWENSTGKLLICFYHSIYSTLCAYWRRYKAYTHLARISVVDIAFLLFAASYAACSFSAFSAASSEMCRWSRWGDKPHLLSSFLCHFRGGEWEVYNKGTQVIPTWAFLAQSNFASATELVKPLTQLKLFVSFLLSFADYSTGDIVRPFA